MQSQKFVCASKSTHLGIERAAPLTEPRYTWTFKYQVEIGKYLMPHNLALFPFGDDDKVLHKDKKSNRTGTFIDNMKLPIHRWFRYSAGFSAEWVKQVLKECDLDQESLILDPFVGSGTTLLSADEVSLRSVGIEAHPFVSRIAKAKLLWATSIPEFIAQAKTVFQIALSAKDPQAEFPPLIQRCFSGSALTELSNLRTAWLQTDNGTPASELVWLAITSILRSASSAGTAQWQYILPNKTKRIIAEPYTAFQAQIEIMRIDMQALQSRKQKTLATLIRGDARNCPEIPDSGIDMVITSPPYANNYDYADATRFEMSFWGEVNSWGDLHETARKYLITSSAQHASRDKLELEAILQLAGLEPIKDEITRVCHALEQERLSHGGKKHYHTMIAAYFADMARVWLELHRMCKPEAKLCFVIGDSAPYGIYVPVEKWLGQLALAVGFRSYRFEKLRDRNTKWKNRKHDVPLHEGHLWIEG